jgi:hypothetical protein
MILLLNRTVRFGWRFSFQKIEPNHSIKLKFLFISIYIAQLQVNIQLMSWKNISNFFHDFTLQSCFNFISYSLGFLFAFSRRVNWNPWSHSLSLTLAANWSWNSIIVSQALALKIAPRTPLTTIKFYFIYKFVCV